MLSQPQHQTQHQLQTLETMEYPNGNSGSTNINPPSISSNDLITLPILTPINRTNNMPAPASATGATNPGVNSGRGNGPTTSNPAAGLTPMPGVKCRTPRALENLMIYENFDVHETHRIEDGICTNLTRLPPKKQEILKQFGIHSNPSVSYYEKYLIVENFIKFCNEYNISDHRPFLDFHESGLPKSEQLKFVRYLGQGLPNLTLNKVYVGFKDVLGLNRIEKITADGYNLDNILKKKKKILYNRMNAAVHRENIDVARQPKFQTFTVSALQ